MNEWLRVVYEVHGGWEKIGNWQLAIGKVEVTWIYESKNRRKLPQLPPLNDRS